jgi:integrase
MKEKILDNNTKLYKRERSNNYYVAVKSFTQKNKYYRQSTNETELRKATVVAKQIAEDIFRNETIGAVVVSKTFGFVAKEFIAKTKDRIEKGIAKKSESEHIATIDRKFMRFFSSYVMTAIKEEDVENYVAKRKVVLSRTRQNTEGASWNALMKFAKNNNYINKEIDFVKTKVSEAKKRLDLTKTEQQKVRQALTYKRETKSKNKKTNEIAELLYDYYYLLLHSAIRVGLEVMRVRYTSFEYMKVSELGKEEQQFFIDADVKEFLVCYLKENETKTDRSRTVLIRTASGAFENALLRIASRTENSCDIHNRHYKKNKLKTIKHKRECLKELFEKCDEYVVRLRSEVGVSKLSNAKQQQRRKSLSEQTSKAFNRLLKDIKLYKDKQGNIRSLYSLRHTYATELLEETGNIVLVAEQLGNDAVVLNEFYNKARATTKASAFVGLTQQAKYKGSTNKETAEVIKEMERLLKQLKT